MTATTETQNKMNVALRYAGTSAATLFSVMGVFQLLTPDQITQLTGALHDLNNSLVTGYGALLKMWVILGPIGVIILGRMGIQSSTVKAMASKLFDIATASAPAGSTPADAKVAIANAADAKDALVAATIALPQVQMVITDKKTSDASPSSSVVAAADVTVTTK